MQNMRSTWRCRCGRGGDGRSNTSETSAVWTTCGLCSSTYTSTVHRQTLDILYSIPSAAGISPLPTAVVPVHPLIDEHERQRNKPLVLAPVLPPLHTAFHDRSVTTRNVAA